MYLSPTSIVATLALLSHLASTANIGRSEVEARDNVAAAKAVLIALKASAFCSSFVPIKDVTSTETISGPPGSTETTVTAAYCTPPSKRKRQPNTTPAKTTTVKTTTAKTTTAKTTTAKTTTAKTTTSKTTTTYASTTASQCSIKGVEPQIASFGCSVIKEACTAYVKPKTVKVSIRRPSPTEIVVQTRRWVRCFEYCCANCSPIDYCQCSWEHNHGHGDSDTDMHHHTVYYSLNHPFDHTFDHTFNHTFDHTVYYALHHSIYHFIHYDLSRPRANIVYPSAGASRKLQK